MSGPGDFHISFGYKGTAYDLNLVKGEESDHTVKINGITYTVLGDEKKLEMACKILSSISITKDSLVTEDDLREKLSVLKDITSPSVEKTGSIGTKTLSTNSIPTELQADELATSIPKGASLHSKNLSQIVLPQMVVEGSINTSLRTNHVSDVVFSHYEIPQETLHLFSEYLNSEGEDKERLKKTLQSQLPTYKGESVESVVRQFVGDKLGMKNFQLEPINVGLSGALVYKVVDNEDKSTRFFIKVFKENPEILAKEVVSLNVLRQLPLQNSSSPHPMGVGKASIDGGNYTFFAQTLAKGVPVTSLMSAVGAKEEQSEEREAAMKKLEIAIRHVGRSLAELWSVRIDQAAQVGSKVREEYLDELIWTTHDIEEVSRGIPLQDIALLQQLDLQAIKNAAEFLKERISLKPELFGFSGYEHTDTNPENLFFDANKDHLTLIDTEGLLKSVGRNGNPIGFPMRDKIGFGENSLPQYAFMKGLTEDEVRRLIPAFHDAYNSAISPIEKGRGPLCSTDAINMMMLAKHSGATLSIFLKLKDGREIPGRLRRHLAYEVAEIKAIVKKIEATRTI